MFYWDCNSNCNALASKKIIKLKYTKYIKLCLTILQGYFTHKYLHHIFDLQLSCLVQINQFGPAPFGPNSKDHPNDKDQQDSQDQVFLELTELTKLMVRFFLNAEPVATSLCIVGDSSLIPGTKLPGSNRIPVREAFSP